DLVAADPVAVLLRHRHPDATGADRRQPSPGRDPSLPRRYLPRLPVPRRHAEGDRLRSRGLLPRVLHRQLPRRHHRGRDLAAPAVRRVAPMDPLTYREAGVNIDAGDEAARRIAVLARRTARPEVIGGIGAVAGVVEGCLRAGCALIGGETAELPDLYAAGEYDLAGFAVGVVERRALIDGRRVAAGDRILGLASSGLHSNGYALARRIVFDVLGL